MPQYAHASAPILRATRINKSGKGHTKVKRSIKERVIRYAAIVMIAALSLALVTLAVITPVSMSMLGLTRHVNYDSVLTPDSVDLNADEITLKTNDELNIRAWFAPSKLPITYGAVIFLSGIQRPSVTYYFPHAAWLAKEGYACLPLEVRAHGASDGERVGLGITEIEDVRAAVQFLKERLPDVPIAIFGVSMGAAAAIDSFGEIQDLSALISLSSYTSWPDVVSQTLNHYYGVPQPLSILVKPFAWLYLGFTFGFDKLSINPLSEIKKANGRPILLMQSLDDSQVIFDNYEALSEAAPDAESFLRDGDNHTILDWDLFLDPTEDTAYADAILSFLDKSFGVADRSIN